MQIFVKTLTGKNITLDGMFPTDSIDTMRQKIREKEGFPVEQQFLVFSGMQLVDGNCSLQAYNIPAFARLHVILRMAGQPLSIVVQLPDGTALPIRIFRSEFIRAVKLKIETTKSIPSHLQGLVFEGEMLDDDMTLMGYKHRKFSNI